MVLQPLYKEIEMSLQQAPLIVHHSSAHVVSINTLLQHHQLHESKEQALSSLDVERLCNISSLFHNHHLFELTEAS